ncbi:MAG: AEC family transporter [Oligoflexia bacterium]|nr:AEC family transporter [Oligoflexia bacterium]
MDNLLLLAACLILGVVLRKSRQLPESTPAVLNSVIVNLSLPALTFVQLHQLKLNASLLYPAAMAWIVFLIGAPLFFAVGRRWKLDRATTGALVLTGCLSNTSFVGFPLLQAFYGPESLETGIIVDQPGSFLVLATLGLITATACSPRRQRGDWRASARGIAKRALSFPPMIALIIALVLHPWPIPAAVEGALDKLAALLIPLALISISFQFDASSLSLRSRSRAENRGLLWSLVFKLVLAPALMVLLYVAVLGLHGRAIQITILEAAMAPMVTGAILASEFGLNTRIASAMLGIGIPLSFLTVPVWAFLIRNL